MRMEQNIQVKQFSGMQHVKAREKLRVKTNENYRMSEPILMCQIIFKSGI